jgi:hypothetical protein
MAAVQRRTGRRGSSYYDRGEERAKAFAAVLRRWREEWGAEAPSENTIAGEIGLSLGVVYHRNSVRRTLDGEARPFHLTPDLAAAYVAALGATDPADVAEAFHAIGLLPPEVTKEALKLAVAASRSGRRHSGSQVA